MNIDERDQVAQQFGVAPEQVERACRPTIRWARMPLIDLGPPQVVTQPPMWPSQSPTAGGPNCTLICIDRHDRLPPQQPPWVTLPPSDAPPLAPQTDPPEPSAIPSAAVSPVGPAA